MNCAGYRVYRKPYPLVLGDDVWRLEKIGKEGAFHRKLATRHVRNVQEFLRMLTVKPDELRLILGEGMTDRMWEVTTNHAKTCAPGDKVYVYSTQLGTIYVNSICQLVKVEFAGVDCPLQQLNRLQKVSCLSPSPLQSSDNHASRRCARARHHFNGV
ncbi:hypothetical protein GUJ93_ZPchr0008g14066 [Zizania palustris]|uniref:Uncharacterized protein n=1 Tax=Zizania palustris TaxID=103762 RepID=A0A8J5RVM4_ZIZPA|nr:hypothetical protein GUJ93_ZPchr0008g14066 [Zizania palustris]